MLSESHLPFVVSEKVGELLKDTDRFDLVIVPEKGDYPEMEGYIKAGGNVLIAGTTRPSLDIPGTVKLWEDAGNSYLHIEDQGLISGTQPQR